MKKIYRTPAALILLALFTSCDKKDLEIDSCATDQSKVVTQELILAPFERIRINGDFEVQIQQSETQKVYITLESNLIEKLNKSVTNKEWKLEFVECDNRKANIPLIIYVPSLKALDLSGSSSITSLKEIIVSDILVSTHGFATAQLDLKSESVSTIMDGPGVITLNGTANTLNSSTHSSGTGYQHLKNLNVKEAVINIKGAGETEVFSSDKIDATIVGSGKVYYYGSPIVTSSVSGTGSVNQVK